MMMKVKYDFNFDQRLSAR